MCPKLTKNNVTPVHHVFNHVLMIEFLMYIYFQAGQLTMETIQDNNNKFINIVFKDLSILKIQNS